MDLDLAYLVNSLAWSGFGFGAGWVACRMARDVHAMSERDDEGGGEDG